MEVKKNWFELKTNFFAIPVLLGVVEGIFLFGLNLGLQTLWDPFIQFNSVFKSVQLIQEIFLFCLIFLCFGYLAIQIKGSFIMNATHEKKVHGALTGIIAGIVYVIVTDYYIATTELIGFQYYQKYLVPDDPYFLKFYFSFLSSCEVVPFLLFVVIFSIIIHAYGAMLQGYISSSLNQIPFEPHRNDIKTRILSNLPSVLFCGVIFLILISTGLSYAAIMTGAIEHKYSCELCIYRDMVSAEKTGIDSIAISLLTEDPSTSWIPLDKRPVFTVFLNGKDVSNSTVVKKQGIAMTLDPPEGLIYQKGSRFILKGPEVFNNTSYCNITVIEKFSATHSLVIFDANVLAGVYS